ncbi:5,6-dimethylbenzimidazole synthase [Aedoeadaptatus ivorii]|uniref:5,6-dimethylbenzimidazole synthase n=1 Tax=Aedoeadaptatus ivorii TaxID=54006 RepID=A0A448V3D3_9FIRM|nr:nitroreductase family protein [Peptoniphilus ivorii]MDQ0508323.1 nitroreductase [Peptoniphilus ivorii]VEJ36298.1 5,6-dimethylbenzimidazole synthase [Peptoniphilus ivorii]
MELKERILKRRAVRKYVPGETMDRDTLLEVLMYASMGPSKGNAHPVEFLLVEDEEKKRKLAAIKRYGTKYLSDAPQILIVMGNTSVDSTWVEEASIAASYLGLLLEEEGFGSSWVNIRDQKTQEGEDAEAAVKKLFNIPPEYGVLALIPFGKQDERLPKRKPFDASEKLHTDSF